LFYQKMVFMEEIIKDGLRKSMSYQTYRDLVKQLAEQHSNTGNEKTETLANYTVLNDRRMKRWDKTLKISEKIENKVKAFNEPVTWLVLIESWCGDGAHILPVLNKLAELNTLIDLKLALRDENPNLMNLFLTDGKQSIPKLVMIDNQTGNVIGTYGPRPTEATAYVNRYKARYGKLSPEFKEDLQHWYNTNKGQNVMDDIAEMLCQLEPNLCL
jgi:septation ring formation regulator EzrA